MAFWWWLRHWSAVLDPIKSANFMKTLFLFLSIGSVNSVIWVDKNRWYSLIYLKVHSPLEYPTNSFFLFVCKDYFLSIYWIRSINCRRSIFLRLLSGILSPEEFGILFICIFIFYAIISFFWLIPRFKVC